MTSLRRRGQAPLELIFVLPVLATIAMAILGLGRIGIASLKLESDVRLGDGVNHSIILHDELLDQNRTPTAGMIDRTIQRSVSGRSLIARSTTLVGSSNSQQVEIFQLPDARDRITLHRDLLRRLAAANAGSFAATIGGLPILDFAARLDPAHP